MKNIKMRLILAVILSGSAIMPVCSKESSKAENSLEAGAGELNKLYSRGQQRVEEKIKEQFGVSEALLTGMLYKKMSYGDIAITLGIAQNMPGGITDKNLYEIEGLRQGPPISDWDKIAEKLSIKLSAVTSKIRNISAEVRKQEKTDEKKEAKKAKNEKLKQKGEKG